MATNYKDTYYNEEQEMTAELCSDNTAKMSPDDYVWEAKKIVDEYNKVHAEAC